MRFRSGSFPLPDTVGGSGGSGSASHAPIRNVSGGDQRTRSAAGPTGQGPALVRACADTWGWHPLAGHGDRGTYVWCEPTAA
ncbi:hypothetical protein ACVV2G_10715 [Streptomyces ziwulingensis]